MKRTPRWISWVMWFLASWSSIIALSLVLEWLVNSKSQVGSGGMNLVPAIFVSAVLFGWILAALIATRFTRK